MSALLRPGPWRGPLGIIGQRWPRTAAQQELDSSASGRRGRPRQAASTLYFFVARVQVGTVIEKERGVFNLTVASELV